MGEGRGGGDPPRRSFSSLDAPTHETVLQLKQRVSELESQIKHLQDENAMLAGSQTFQAWLPDPGQGPSAARALASAPLPQRGAGAVMPGHQPPPPLNSELLLLKERALHAVREGIVIASCTLPDMPLVYVNNGFCRLTGYALEEVLGRNCRFLQGPATDKATLDRLRSAIKNGRPAVVQLINYKRNGDPFVNYLSVTPIFSAKGRLSHFVGIQADVTDLTSHKQAALAATHAASLASAATEAKSQFLARMSHEIRTPLNGMISVGQMLAGTTLDPVQRDLVDTIRVSGETLLTLVSDILDVSRIEADRMVLNPKKVELQSVIEAAVEIAGLLAADRRLQMAYYLAPSVPATVITDGPRLQQVLLNVLNNAVKFTETGAVLLEMWAVPAPQAAGSQQSGDPARVEVGGTRFAPPALAARRSFTLHFRVQDTGIGIGQADLSRLFQPFSQVDASQTRAFGGSGLGLTISMRLCEALGGSMWAESRGLGWGSTFHGHIRIEAVPEEDDHAAASARKPSRMPSTERPPSTPKGLRGLRVLLAEPCLVVRQVAAVVLRRAGCTVLAPDSEAEVAVSLRLRSPAAQGAMTRASGAAPSGAGPWDPAAGGGSGAGATLRLACEVDELEVRPTQAARDRPFDIVVMDARLDGLLHLLSWHAAPEEASCVVFLGWPGEAHPPGLAAGHGAALVGLEDLHLGGSPAEGASPSPHGDSCLPAAAALPPPLPRRLTYAVVSRPVRHTRLLSALRHVLAAAWGSAAGGRGPASGPRCGGAADARHAPGTCLSRAGGDAGGAPPAPSPGARAAARERRAGMRLLLAEDNAINMKVALRLLGRMGYTQVETAQDGEQALSSLVEAGGPDAFHAILMDLHMPGLDGIEVLEEAKRRWPEFRSPFVAVTADAFQETRDRCVAVCAECMGLLGGWESPFGWRTLSVCWKRARMPLLKLEPDGWGPTLVRTPVQACTRSKHSVPGPLVCRGGLCTPQAGRPTLHHARLAGVFGWCLYMLCLMFSSTSRDI
uniref:LOV domain-containing protein n=1 Tax=Auxenochlorella protothecoides TaxID=3075 RepID=A0A1D2A0P0_AUXPR